MEEKFQAVWFDPDKYGEKLTVDNFEKIYQEYLQIANLVMEQISALDEKYSEQDLKTFSEIFSSNLREKLYFPGIKEVKTIEELLDIYSKNLEESAKFEDELKKYLENKNNKNS